MRGPRACTNGQQVSSARVGRAGCRDPGTTATWRSTRCPDWRRWRVGNGGRQLASRCGRRRRRLAPTCCRPPCSAFAGPIRAGCGVSSPVGRGRHSYRVCPTSQGARNCGGRAGCPCHPRRARTRGCGDCSCGGRSCTAFATARESSAYSAGVPGDARGRGLQCCHRGGDAVQRRNSPCCRRRDGGQRRQTYAVHTAT
jgi:hypothetical protein